MKRNTGMCLEGDKKVPEEQAKTAVKKLKLVYR